MRVLIVKGEKKTLVVRVFGGGILVVTSIATRQFRTQLVDIALPLWQQLTTGHQFVQYRVNAPDNLAAKRVWHPKELLC